MIQDTMTQDTKTQKVKKFKKFKTNSAIEPFIIAKKPLP